jgi:hypothetical protein
MAYNQNKSVFSSLDSARTCVRNLRGQAGEKSRGRLEHAAPELKSPRTHNDSFGKIPEPRNRFKARWGAVQIAGPERCLVLSDIHIPFHDRDALITALDYGKGKEPTVILLNGDTCDFHAISKWETDPRERRFAEELKSIREFLSVLRESFPRARIIFKLGNHEERFESYMFTKAPELLDVADFEFNSLLKFKDLGIEEVRDKNQIRLGELSVIHGHEYRFMISNPVNPARGLFLRARAHAMCGHFHQTSHHQAKDINGHGIAVWSTGCLCQLNTPYLPYNEWRHGFAYVEVDNQGKFEVRNHFISKGKVY